MNSLMMIFLVLSPNLIQIMASDETETEIENANQDEKLSCFIYANIDMYIASHLPEQGQPLTFHCGANNDVNAHSLTLSPNHHFHFHFCMRPFAEFYFCSTFWGDKTAAFVVYSTSNKYCDGKRAIGRRRVTGFTSGRVILRMA
ncbi:hypothetical protein ABFS83_07G092900 [Erythranthe nasuta]